MQSKQPRFRLYLFWLIFFSFPVFSQNEYQADEIISQIYSQLQYQPQDLSKRIAFISNQFLGKPYLLSALGEGSEGYFDQTSLYRTDAFDCETYVDTVLALALGHNLAEFKQLIRKIRYKDGQVGFLTRNHFTCIDWNKNNQDQGFLKDITPEIHDQQNTSIALNAEALINKPGWYEHFTINKIRLYPSSPTEASKRLAILKKKGQTLPIVNSTIAYLPLTTLLNNLDLFKQIPNGAVIEIVRPNWDLTKEIGTHLNISHLGFAIWENNTLFFREASSKSNTVMQIPLIDYLREASQSPTIKGINVQILKDIAK